MLLGAPLGIIFVCLTPHVVIQTGERSDTSESNNATLLPLAAGWVLNPSVPPLLPRLARSAASSDNTANTFIGCARRSNAERSNENSSEQNCERYSEKVPALAATHPPLAARIHAAASALYLDHVSDAYETGARQCLRVGGLETGEGETDVDAEDGSLPLALPLVVSALLREKAPERTLRREAAQLLAEEKFPGERVPSGHGAPRAALQQPEGAAGGGGGGAVALGGGLDRKSLPSFLLPGLEWHYQD